MVIYLVIYILVCYLLNFAVTSSGADFGTYGFWLTFAAAVLCVVLKKLGIIELLDKKFDAFVIKVKGGKKNE